MCSLKRINHEKKKFYTHALNNYFSFDFTNIYDENEKISAEVLISKNNRVEAIIDVVRAYPFKPPRVYICQANINKKISYIDWSYRGGEKINKIINKNNHTRYELLLVWFFIINKNYEIIEKIPDFSLKIPQDCFCCSTILCQDKWSPSRKITDIVIEILLRKELFNLFTEKGIRYIEKIFKNEKWDLSEDVILLILEKII
jgi:ubiquitin-protein ligase